MRASAVAAAGFAVGLAALASRRIAGRWSPVVLSTASTTLTPARARRSWPTPKWSWSPGTGRGHGQRLGPVAGELSVAQELGIRL